jgi:hypothetical protein
MALTIEDGSGVAGANSYATVAEARAYALARGLSLPAGDSDVEKALVLACDKIETYKFKGRKTDEANALEWPRAGVYVGSSEIEFANDEIPDRLKSAQCQFAAESAAGTNLQPTGTGREVIRTKVDVLETEYAPRGSGSVTPQFNKAEALLAALLASGGAFGLTVTRA